MSVQIDTPTADAAAIPAEQTEIGELTAIVTATIPEGGLDRMTSSRLEEFMTPVALTAHL